jgi:methylated-DNA-[protein]-cysteine S-methyltransferase
MTTIFTHEFATPIGTMIAAVDADGALARLWFGDAQSARATVAALGSVVRDADACAGVVAQLEEYFRLERRDFDMPLAPRGTPFQLRVWNALRRIPYGVTISYGELARRVGDSGGARAVGRANGANPIPIVVPCHRVIGADKSLTGYGGGMHIKRALLELERAPGFETLSLL